MAGKVQIRDVAEHAGVSVGTVSNVLNGLTSVKPQNLDRVRQSMKELGFVPNFHARQLRIERGDSIGLLVLSVANPFYAEIAHVAEGVAEEHGAIIVMGSSDHSAEREDRYLTLFEASRVRGLLIAPVGGITPRLQQFQQRGIPTVLLDDNVSGGEFCSVSLDGHAAGKLAVEHLLELGRRRIMVIGGPLALVTDRVSGAGAAVADVADATLAYRETGDLSVSEGRRAAQHVLELPTAQRPEAIFAANDLIALGVLHELILAGVRIPQDIAIVGYDDIDFAATAIVPLTSVRQPREEIAREAIELLIAEETDADQHHHSRRLLPAGLSVRASSAGRA